MRAKFEKIFWREPLPIDDAKKSLPDNEICLYYITRKFNGIEKSLYIGERTRSIKSRLLSHKDWVYNYSHSKIYVRFGNIVYPKQDIENAIKHTEKALIFEHE